MSGRVSMPSSSEHSGAAQVTRAAGVALRAPSGHAGRRGGRAPLRGGCKVRATTPLHRRPSPSPMLRGSRHFAPAVGQSGWELWSPRRMNLGAGKRWFHSPASVVLRPLYRRQAASSAGTTFCESPIQGLNFLEHLQRGYRSERHKEQQKATQGDHRHCPWVLKSKLRVHGKPQCRCGAD